MDWLCDTTCPPLSVDIWQLPRSMGGAGCTLHTDRLEYIYSASRGEAMYAAGLQEQKPVRQKTAHKMYNNALRTQLTEGDTGVKRLLDQQNNKFAAAWLRIDHTRSRNPPRTLTSQPL